MKEKILGRQYEIQLLHNCMNSNKSEFVVVYGRRRVGKTFLLKNCFTDDYDFSFTGTYNEPLSIQLKYFFNALSLKPQSNFTKPKNWIDAFNFLKKYLLSIPKETVTVFLDELPWLDTPKSNFISALSYFWNNFTEKKIKLFTCGSATTWMINKLLGDKGGLYGRTSKSIYLPPFSLKETKEYIQYRNETTVKNEDVLQMYMVTGGIPYYLDYFNLKIPFSVNIDDLFFKQGGALKNEYNFVFKTLFNESVNYKKVISAIASKSTGLTRDEISSITSISGGKLTEILENLRLCDFVKCYSSIMAKEKNKLYQLIDMYTLFYLKFIDDSDSQDPDYWTKNFNTQHISTWSGYAFEIACLNNISSIKKSLGISGISTNVYSWNTKAYTDNTGAKWDGAQIDLILDRADNLLNIIEIKHCNGLFVIDKQYNEKLINRISNFRNKTKTKKGIINTFITTNGIKQNEYSSTAFIQLTLNDLFN